MKNRTLPPLTSQACRDLFEKVRADIVTALKAGDMVLLQAHIDLMNSMRLEQHEINVSNGMSPKVIVPDTIESATLKAKELGMI